MTEIKISIIHFFLKLLKNWGNNNIKNKATNNSPCLLLNNINMVTLYSQMSKHQMSELL